jgi:glyoxylase-like metal-dependent hydrolase (beta-lactamase superfamily II)
LLSTQFNASEQVGEGIFAVDTHYVRPKFDASHLIVDAGEAAFVDTGTNHSVPGLLAALRARDLPVEAVKYIFLTHVHLDHAGGAGLLAQYLPRARVIVHPRGAPHLIDPAKLIVGTRAVYGAALYEKLYGQLLPIPQDRVGVVQDGDRIAVGSRVLEFLHTPGHALHHVCIVDRDSREIFSGDIFGVSYREFDTAAGEFVMATTTPTQFDPAQMHESIDKILTAGPRAIYLTHYSRVNAIERLGADLHADVDRYVGIAAAYAAAPDRIRQMQARLFEYLSARLDAHGCTLDAPSRHRLLDGDVRLNAAGLDAWLSRRIG